MPVFELEESTGSGDGEGFSLIPDGTVADAVVTSVEVKTKPFKDDDGKDIIRCEFAFTLKGGEYDGRRVWGETSTKFSSHPDCRLRNWTQEIIGQELPVGFRLNTDSLVGSDCRVAIAVKKYKTREGVAKERNFVGDVLRTRDSVAFAAADEPF